MIAICIFAEVVDHSEYPVLMVAATVFELFFLFLGVWKALELFNKISEE